jgi:hypothetical protein
MKCFNAMKHCEPHIMYKAYFVHCNCVEKGTSWLSAGMIAHKFNISFFSNIILLTNLERYSYTAGLVTNAAVSDLRSLNILNS